jgi:DivIVA domain-containing protein
MEISARVLREVEFNSSLRGYNTDEVDEFLEQVADGVDRLQAEVKVAADRAENAERTAQNRTGLDDDDSIRRTLILAQRTADLAIREAQEEASQILDRARGEAETLVGDARDSAERMISDAERRLHDDVTRLSTTRDALQTEVDTLLSLLGAERERLTETLGAALRYVERSLSPSASLMSLQSASHAPDAAGGAGGGFVTTADPDPGEAHVVDSAAAPPGPYTIVRSGEETAGDAAAGVSGDGPDQEDHDDTIDPGGAEDVEAAVAEDADAAAPEHPVEAEPDHYDWDSVVRDRPEPVFGEGSSAVERANLTSVPPLDESSQDAAALKAQGSDTDWSA